MVKPLAFPSPGGHNLLIEWDIFYPLPSSWRVPKPPPPPTTTTEKIEIWDPHDHDSGTIWMPGSGWTSDVIDKLKDESADKRYWNAARVGSSYEIFIELIFSTTQQPQQANRREWNRNNLFRVSPPLSVTQYQNPLFYQRLLQPKDYSNQKINSNQRNYQPGLSSPENVAMNKQRQMNYPRRGRSLGNDDEHHSHRERRDLYKQIEASSPL